MSNSISLKSETQKPPRKHQPLRDLIWAPSGIPPSWNFLQKVSLDVSLVDLTQYPPYITHSSEEQVSVGEICRLDFLGQGVYYKMYPGFSPIPESV